MAEPIDVGQYAAVPAQVDAPSDLLAVHDLHVHFPTDDGLVKAVDGLSFTLDRGQTLGIVGESGSGKSVTSLGILGLHHGTSARITGQVWLDGEELINAGTARVRALRGNKMAMIFQDPLSSLHPYYTVGNQIIEAYRIHNEVSKQAARKHAIEMLNRVGIPQAADRVDDYPHQFSGGMRQRVMIAMALSCDPELLIADEPTTALAVTVQAQILDLISIKGTPPSLINVPSGCAFHPRCAYADRTGGRSTDEVPPLRETADGHLSACHLTISERHKTWTADIKPLVEGTSPFDASQEPGGGVT